MSVQLVHVAMPREREHQRKHKQLLFTVSDGKINSSIFLILAYKK